MDHYPNEDELRGYRRVRISRLTKFLENQAGVKRVFWKVRWVDG